MHKSTKKLFALSSMALAILATNQVVAQGPMLEEVVVTATKREAGMQDVPIALLVMGGEKITEQGINDLEDMAVFMPNVHIAEAGAGDQLFIRGVGSGVNYGFEQSVGTFIDGLYFGRGQASRSTFLDVARVEILKGPQSTLFGKNTIAGAINITTMRPGDEFEGSIEASYEPEFDAWSSTLILSGPVTDDFGARLVLKRAETDGYVDNTFLDEDERQVETTIGRIVLDWRPTDSLDLTFKWESGESETVGRQDMITVATDFTLGEYQKADPDFRAGFGYDKSQKNIGGIRSDGQWRDSEWDIFALTADWAIGEYSLKSVTGYVDYKFDEYVDGDYGPQGFLGRGRDEAHEQFSQEFLLSSPLGETLEYLAGLYYQKEDLEHDKYTDAIFSGAGIGGGAWDATTPGTFQQDSETWSVFTQLTWNVSDSLRLIGGLRYSEDEKEFSKTSYVADPFTFDSNQALAGLYDAVLNFATDYSMGSDGATRCTGLAYVCTFYPDFDNTREEDHVTGDITVQWDATDTMMTYAKISNGYKAGGFDEGNGRGYLDAAEYEDENVVSYEIGAKMDLWDGRGRLNVAIFRSEFEDVQVSTFDGNISFIVGNAAESEVNGFEVDGSVALTEAFTLSGGLAYLDATYKSFPDAACNEPQVVEFVASGGTRNTCTQDLAGKPLQFAPEWSANLALDYEKDIADSLYLRMGLDLAYSDDYHVANDLDPVLDQASFTKVNARIGLSSASDTWSIAILGKNLTDEKTTTWGNDVPLAPLGYGETYFQHIDPPRSIELQARYNF